MAFTFAPNLQGLIDNPTVYQDSRLIGDKGFYRDIATIPSGTAVGDVTLFHRVSVFDFINYVKISTPAGLGTSAAVNVGVWYESAAGVYTVIDADEFASAFAVATGVQPTDITTEAGVTLVANACKVLWDRLGLSDVPTYPYFYIGIEQTVITATTGSIVLEVQVA